MLCSLLLLMMAAASAPSSWAQQEAPPSAYVNDAVVQADGSNETDTPPQATFTAYLNRNPRRVLIENAPIWTDRDANINGQGRLGLQAGNFPALEEGDSLFIRYTDRADGQQGVLAAHLAALPYDDYDPTGPFTPFQLAEVGFPERPEEVALEVNEATGMYTITWADVDGLTYQVYRRALQDRIFTGASRKLYRRLGASITGGQFVDESADADTTYAYIVYAQDADGAVSAHSEEVVQHSQVTGLRAAATTARNVTLRWNAFTVPVGQTAGYNVYRRQKGESYGLPVGYTGTRDTLAGQRYTDTRLEPGATYFYEVRARNARLRDDENGYEEYGASEELKVTTEASTEGYSTYASLEVAVLLYRNADKGESGKRYHMSDEEVEEIKFLLNKSKGIYWRNSGMKLNLNLTYYPIEEYKDLTSNNVARTMNYLKSQGVMRTQYDMVFRIDPTVSGFWSIGAGPRSQLPGSDRGLGFFQITWPLLSKGPAQDFEGYPGRFSNITQIRPSLIWFFLHEGEHTIDDLYFRNGHREMGHGDFPELYGQTNIPSDEPGSPGYPEGFGKRFGKRFSFQATILRDFNAYEDLKPEWGKILETRDQDGDGVPDEDPRVTLDENRFNSSPTQVDTDGDGYSDLQEATDGIYYYSTSDPRDSDTDDDGVPDGADEHPRYPVNTTVQKMEGFQPSLDADVSEWPDSTLVDDAVSKAIKGQGGYSPKVYMAYNSDSLYVAMDLDDIAIPELAFDFDADGRWYGAGNTIMAPDPTESTFNRFQSWDARKDVQKCLETGRCTEGGEGEHTRTSGDGMWDTSSRYQRQFGRRVIDPDDVELVVDRDGRHIQIEMAIPQSKTAGLTLNPGDQFGFYADYSKVGNVPGAKATTFDQWSYVYMTLEGEKTATQPVAEASEAVLGSNYPNPFYKQTTFSYEVAQPGSVTLTVYDVMGRRVATLAQGHRAPGAYKVHWNGADASGQAVASGTYFYRLKTPSGSRTRTMTVVD